MTKKQKIERKIEKCKNKGLKDFNPWLAYVHHVFHPVAVFTNFRTFAVILRDFFFLQFFEKLHIFKIPVISVDHELDNKIPFIPKKVDIYLDFINLWVRPLEMLAERLCYWDYGKACKRWMRMFRNLYIQAGKIYYFRLTTTNRPDYNEMREFRQIHAVDPHYLCVPSLHIATISLVFGFYRKFFVENEFTQSEIAKWQTEIYNEAIQIADSVLYVKQHSVNCIPAALYMVVSNFEEYFSADDARKFLDDMFSNPQDFAEEDAKEVKDFMKNRFEKYLEEGKTCENWYEPVRNFLLSLEK